MSERVGGVELIVIGNEIGHCLCGLQRLAVISGPYWLAKVKSWMYSRLTYLRIPVLVAVGILVNVPIALPVGSLKHGHGGSCKQALLGNYCNYSMVLTRPAGCGSGGTSRLGQRTRRWRGM